MFHVQRQMHRSSIIAYLGARHPNKQHTRIPGSWNAYKHMCMQAHLVSEHAGQVVVGGRHVHLRDVLGGEAVKAAQHLRAGGTGEYVHRGAIRACG